MVRKRLYDYNDVQEMIDSLKCPEKYEIFKANLDVECDSDKRAIFDVLHNGYYERFDRYDSEVCEAFIRNYERLFL